MRVLTNINIGVPAKRSKHSLSKPFYEAEFIGNWGQNQLFAVPPILEAEYRQNQALLTRPDFAPLSSVTTANCFFGSNEHDPVIVSVQRGIFTEMIAGIADATVQSPGSNGVNNHPFRLRTTEHTSSIQTSYY